MNEEVELEIKIKLKIAVEVQVGPQDESVIIAQPSGEKDKCCSCNGKYKIPDKRFTLFFVPYIFGTVLFLLLIGLNVQNWEWDYKAALFLISAGCAVVASIWKGFLTNWNDAVDKYSQKGVDERKSLCDGIATVFALIAILSAFSSAASSHKAAVTTEDLQKSLGATTRLVCNLYAEQNKPCELPTIQPNN